MADWEKMWTLPPAVGNGWREEKTRRKREQNTTEEERAAVPACIAASLGAVMNNSTIGTSASRN